MVTRCLFTAALAAPLLVVGCNQPKPGGECTSLQSGLVTCTDAKAGFFCGEPPVASPEGAECGKDGSCDGEYRWLAVSCGGPRGCGDEPEKRAHDDEKRKECDIRGTLVGSPCAAQDVQTDWCSDDKTQLSRCVLTDELAHYGTVGHYPCRGPKACSGGTYDGLTHNRAVCDQSVAEAGDAVYDNDSAVYNKRPADPNLHPIDVVCSVDGKSLLEVAKLDGREVFRQKQPCPHGCGSTSDGKEWVSGRGAPMVGSTVACKPAP